MNMHVQAFCRCRHFLAPLGIAFIALFLSAIVVRVPAAWSLIPMMPTKLLASVIQPTGQEAAADVEFLGIWVVCFGAIGTGWVATVVLWKRFSGERAN
jgi:hypothetical protein